MNPLAQPDLFSWDTIPRKKRPNTVPNPVKAERQRLNAAARRVLARLQQGPALNWELCTPEIGGLRGIGRVHEIQKDGWRVTKEHVKGGIWRYTLSHTEKPAW